MKMDVEAELSLSYYKQIGVLNERHGVVLVQHTETGRVFVKKTLEIYDLRVYEIIRANRWPGIPPIAELVETGGQLHVIEEYISGLSLREIMDSRGPLPEAEAIGYIRQICKILEPLHRLTPPVVHRDIKPGNLILSSWGQIYLVDFDSAKKTSPGVLGQDTVLIGTAGYAAPEQFGFSPSRPAADIYALGVLLNEMLTGRMPQEQIYDGGCWAVIHQCLQMEPSLRYADAGRLLSALPDKENNARPKSPAEIGACLRSWLPPGLRRPSPWRIVLALLWYAFIISLSCTATISESSDGNLTIYRIGTFCILFGETLWLGNYRNCWALMPLSSSKNRLTAILGTALWAFCLLAILIVATGIIGG